MNTLGLIANNKRTIKSGLEFDSLFPAAKLMDDVIIRDGSVKDTVHLMSDVVHKYIDDTKLIAEKLKGKNLEETCKNIWDFVYTHIQYSLDKKGLEQLRRPARSWYDRISGVDCDCYSIFISSVLTNLGIPHKFRITKYDGDWQHVYVVVPKSQGGNYIIDCVVDKFNYEKPYTGKFQYNMTTLNGLPIAVLSGLDHAYDSELFGIISGVDFAEIDYLNGIGATPSAEKELQAIYNHLVRTRDYILQDPKSVITAGGPKTHLEMLNYAIDNWNTPNRDKALETLEQEEVRWNQHNGISGNNSDDEEINGLGAPKSKKKFWGKVKEVTKKAGQGIKKIGKSIIRYNPLSLAVRGGFLLAMKINLLDMAKKLYPAYLSEGEAKNKGISSEQRQKVIKALEKIEKLFVNKLQGKADKLKNAIIGGRARKQFHGFGQIGEPATITSVVASAAPLIAAYEEIKKAGLQGIGEEAEDSISETTKAGFIQLVKNWWKKTFGKESTAAPETISEDDKAPDEKDGDDKDGKSEGIISKISSFVKENPGKTFTGVAVAGTIITLAASPKARHAVGLGATPKRKRRKPRRSSASLMNLK